MDFLAQVDLRPLSLPDEAGFHPVGLALGKGPHALEVAIVESQQQPTVSSMRKAWKARLGGRAVPLLFVVLYAEKDFGT